MRILLLSDTHGNLDIINLRVDEANADIVIHSGDFGFYLEDSVHHLSDRELFLLVVHSPVVSDDEKDTKSRIELQSLVKKYGLLGDFQSYVNGQKRLDKPLYAVWGNHEDKEVVRQLREGQIKCENLNILDENNSVFLDGFHLFGLGGNFLPGRKIFDKPLAGSGGKIWSTLEQYGRLLENMRKVEGPSIFVSHVSPGKEPLLWRLMLHVMPRLMISGHMGTPYASVWNHFGVMPSTNEATLWMEEGTARSDLETIENLFHTMGEVSPYVRKAMNALLTSEYEWRTMKRGIKEPTWLRDMWSLNLPDAKDGYAVLNVKDGAIGLETFSAGIRL